MTYTVDVTGMLKVVVTPPLELTKDWKDFKIRMSENKQSVFVELHGRTPYYNDVVAKLFVLGHYYNGELAGKGEDGENVKVKIPPTMLEIIDASERNRWEPRLFTYQKDYIDRDRFHHELSKIGYVDMYPKWLDSVKKKGL